MRVAFGSFVYPIRLVVLWIGSGFLIVNYNELLSRTTFFVKLDSIWNVGYEDRKNENAK